MRPLFSLTALLCLTLPAHASVGFSCVADDAAMKLIVQGAYGRSIGSGVGSFGGEAEIKLKGVTADARKLNFESQHLTQNWFHGRDLKLTVSWTKDGTAPLSRSCSSWRRGAARARRAPIAARMR